MLYDVTDHALLSVEASSLTPEALAEYAQVACDLLGLRAPALTGEYGAKATRAVALQVNHLVELGAEGMALQSESRGKRSRTFGAGTINAAARAIVSQLPGMGPGGSWPAMVSVRGR